MLEQWKDKGGTKQFPLKRQFDKAIFIGRMEPPHLGHMHVLRKAAEIADEVLILCGSNNRARSIKNPWRMDDREIMIGLAIHECVPELEGRYRVIGINDYTYNDHEWAKEVGLKVAKAAYTGHTHGDGYFSGPSIALVGHRKEGDKKSYFEGNGNSGYYFDFFPQWKYVEVEGTGEVNATAIRKLYFEENTEDFIMKAQGQLPHSVISYMATWKGNVEFTRLLEEYQFIKKYKASWEVAPYAPTFVTTDAVMIESGHVLMIKRGGKPGNGQWALPGGFLDAGKGERIRDGVRRELVEETKIDVPPAMLLDLFRKAKSEVFDHPDRDLRGRIITHAFLVELPTRQCGLSKVKGSDDAAYAQWIPLHAIQGMAEDGEIFSDHADIIFNMTGKI